MSNYFLLELDTTPPEIEIYAPQYTFTDIETEIRVQSNEQLSLFQEIYIVDSKNNRYDMTFLYNGSELIGKFTCNMFSLGIATLYARVEDVVGNKSALISKSFNIKLAPKLNLVTREFIQDIIGSSIKNCNLKIQESIPHIRINTRTNTMRISKKTQKLSVEMEVVK